jgi:hypothetical protein
MIGLVGSPQYAIFNPFIVFVQGWIVYTFYAFDNVSYQKHTKFIIIAVRIDQNPIPTPLLSFISIVLR